MQLVCRWFDLTKEEESVPSKVASHGQCDSRFERVSQVFAENFERRGEVGAGVAVTVGGRFVVDLWGGYADAARIRPWQRETMVNVWSTTKGLCAVCAHRLADQAKLDFEAPVAKYWPEFAAAGKGHIPVKYLLSHKAGLAAIRAPLKREDLFDWQKVTAELARQEVVGQFGSYPPVIPARLLCLAREESRNPGPFARQPRARVTRQKLKLTRYPAGTVVGARQQTRLSRDHLRMVSGRDGAPNYR